MFYKIIMVLTVLFSLLGFQPQRIHADIEPIISKVTIPVTLEQHIQRIFGDKADVATAVFKHESGLSLNKINYNCIYTTQTVVDGKTITKKKSRSCDKEDRIRAWSVDCGIAQINTRGKTCPAKLFTLEGNMKMVEKIYDEQGLRAWVSYTSGAYKKFL